MSRPPLSTREFKRLLERRKPMTICIAAICQQDKDNDEKRIVLCHDWKSETEIGGSETSDKQRELPKGWVALMADTMYRCEELVAQYERHLRGLGEVLDDRQLFEEMKIPAANQKEVLANDYLRQMMGISYADLVSPVKTFPESIVEDRLNEVAQIQLRASLILAGFVSTQQSDNPEKEKHPYLFVVEDSKDHQGVVRVEENFAAIGSGSYVAIPAMHQRAHEDDMSLMETIYTVLEAKRLSQVVPGVGQDTTLHVMYPDGSLKRWSNALYDRLDWLFDRLGPKLIITDKKSKEYFEFKDEYLIPFDADEEEEKPKDTSLRRPASRTPKQGQ
jgi:hypothetical protein